MRVHHEAERWVAAAVGWLKLGVETAGATVIAIGMVVAVAGVVRVMLFAGDEGFVDIRLRLARYLVLALEFQLAADILSTAISPTWEQIGQLGAIAVIRTGLNYFLTHEMRGEQGEVRRDEVPGPG